MRFRAHSLYSPAPTLDDLRAQALASAIALRNCALNVETSPAGRRACRCLMRSQAILWRLPFDISRN